jgi:hypothetical protein
MPFGVIIANDSRQLEKLRQFSSFDSTDRHDRPDQGSMLLGVSHFWVVSLCEVVDQNSSSIFVPFASLSTWLAESIFANPQKGMPECMSGALLKFYAMMKQLLPSTKSRFSMFIKSE